MNESIHKRAIVNKNFSDFLHNAEESSLFLEDVHIHVYVYYCIIYNIQKRPEICIKK